MHICAQAAPRRTPMMLLSFWSQCHVATLFCFFLIPCKWGRLFLFNELCCVPSAGWRGGPWGAWGGRDSAEQPQDGSHCQGGHHRQLRCHGLPSQVGGAVTPEAIHACYWTIGLKPMWGRKSGHHLWMDAFHNCPPNQINFVIRGYAEISSSWHLPVCRRSPKGEFAGLTCAFR